jgi:esterase
MRLHFHAQGQGPSLIILHGLFGSSDNWLPIARTLSGRFRVFAVDQRNHGRSPHSGEMNYRLMADDLAEFMDAQGLERASVLGHSMGGKTAMRLAQLHPARIEKLAVADMAPRAYPPAHERIYKALLSLHPAAFRSRPDVGRVLASEIPDEALRLFLLKMLGRRADGTLFWQTGLRELHANSGHLRAALPETPAFQGPALFIRGEESDYVRDDDIPTIRRLFPQATIRTVMGAGHWLHVDAPDAFCRDLRAFLSA